MVKRGARDLDDKPPQKRVKRTPQDRPKTRTRSSESPNENRDVSSSVKGGTRRAQSKGGAERTGRYASNSGSRTPSEEPTGDVSPGSQRSERAQTDDMYLSSELSEEEKPELRRGDSGTKDQRTPGSLETLPPEVTQLLKEVFSGGSQRSNNERATLRAKPVSKVRRGGVNQRKSTRNRN